MKRNRNRNRKRPNYRTILDPANIRQEAGRILKIAVMMLEKAKKSKRKPEELLFSLYLQNLLALSLLEQMGREHVYRQFTERAFKWIEKERATLQKRPSPWQRLRSLFN